MYSMQYQSSYDLTEVEPHHHHHHQFREILSPKNYRAGNIRNSMYESDEFRMYTFKIKRCSKMRSHDWTECPYAHRGEKARRRDPRKYHYNGIACTEYRLGDCKKGELCEFAHGIFEFWLHPSRYRTRLCNSGLFCRRKVCFFAHSVEQLRPETKYKSKSCSSFEYRNVGENSIGNGVEMEMEIVEVSKPLDSLRNGCNNPFMMTENWDILETLKELKIDQVDHQMRRNGFSCDVPADMMPDIGWISELLS